MSRNLKFLWVEDFTGMGEEVRSLISASDRLKLLGETGGIKSDRDR
ncbi:hypothetical protein [Coleofasciculus sp. E1-EBD-02]